MLGKQAHEQQTVDVAERETAILRAARDDLSQFAPLYQSYYPRIYRFCLARVGSSHDASDLANTVFTNALRSIHTYRGGSVTAWLFRIARNTVTDHYRRVRVSISIEVEAVNRVDESLTPLLEHVIQSEAHELIRQLVSELDDYERELVNLRFIDKLTSQEMAEMLGKRPNTIRVQIHRIIKKLRVRYLEEMA